MENEIEKIPIVRLTEEGSSNVEDTVVREFSLTVVLNDQELVTLLCSPRDLEYLAIGFLFSEGLLSGKDEIQKIMVDEQRGVAWVEAEEDKALATEHVFKQSIASGGGRGSSFKSTADVPSQANAESPVQISAHQVFKLMDEFIQYSEVFRATGGVHSAALCDAESIIVFSEDIGRHNAIDKIFGECILRDIPTDKRVVITSGRISSEILLKVARRNIPIIISKAAPTDLGVKLADDLGMTLLGFVRGRRMNIYTNDWRIVPNDK